MSVFFLKNKIDDNHIYKAGSRSVVDPEHGIILTKDTTRVNKSARLGHMDVRGPQSGLITVSTLGHSRVLNGHP